LWSFRVMEAEFYAIESERRPQNVESHEQVKKKHGIK